MIAIFYHLMNDYHFGFFFKSSKIDSIIDKYIDGPNVLGLPRGTPLHFGELPPKALENFALLFFQTLYTFFM
jgi:hypothetical protein